MTHHLNDPDFDQPKDTSESTNKQTILDYFPQKTLFVAGIVAGMMVLCTIGFFILLSLFFK